MICDMCEKELGGHSLYCPENPKSVTEEWMRPGHKWSHCVCFVHTCYDAKALRVPQEKK